MIVNICPKFWKLRTADVTDALTEINDKVKNDTDLLEKMNNFTDLLKTEIQKAWKKNKSINDHFKEVGNFEL